MNRIIFVTCALTLVLGCGEQPDIDYEAPVDSSRQVGSLSDEEVASVCESVAEVERPNIDRLLELACKSVASYASTNERCLAIYEECRAANVSVSCDSERSSPREQPLCDGITVAQLEAGIRGWLNARIPESIEEICALPPEDRTLTGDLGRLGVPEVDIDGYNCAVNSTLTPYLPADPSVCWDDLPWPACL